MTADQQNLASLLAQYNYYLNPGMYDNTKGGYAGGAPATGALPDTTKYGIPGLASNTFGQSGTTAGQVLDFVDPLNALIPGIGIFNSLFGKKAKAPTWQPYATADGKYVWTSPQQANPVPLSNVPGSSLAPSQEYQDLANQVRSVSDLLPYYSQAISAQKIPDAMGQLAADTATTGPRLALQESLQRQYGPIFDQLAAESNLRRAQYSAANDAAVIKGPGKDLIAQALEAAKLADPEYYGTRTKTANSVGALLDQTTANLGSGLSATERDEVGRGLALEGARRGTANAPSNLDTVANATAFGAAGRARETQNQNQLSQAIAASTAFLPAAKSGVDAFQVATGRPSATMDNRFNTNTANADAGSAAQGLLNTGASFWTTNANNAAAMQRQNDQQKSQQVGQIIGGLSSVGSLLMCWVAREVYGADNPKWEKFRQWVVFQSPNWFFHWYMFNGERFAEYIKDKPLLKRIIRCWMDSKIKG